MGREGYRFGEEARMKPELMCEQNEKLVFIAIERELKTMVNTTHKQHIQHVIILLIALATVMLWGLYKIALTCAQFAQLQILIHSVGQLLYYIFLRK